MKVTVKLFARARDTAGKDAVEVELPQGARVADLREALTSQYPALGPIAAALHVAIANDYADDETPIDPNAEIACFPPVSGG